MGDFKAFQLAGLLTGLFPKRTEIWAVDFVFALHLFDHQFGVGNDTQSAVLVLQAPGENAEECGVFCVIVRALAEEFAETGENAAVLILNYGAIAGWTGVTPGAAVAMGDEQFGGGGS